MKNPSWIAYFIVISISVAACTSGGGTLLSTQATSSPIPQHTVIPFIEAVRSPQPAQLEIPTAYPGQVTPLSLSDAYPAGFASPTLALSTKLASTATSTLTPTWALSTITPFPARPTPTLSWDACSNHPPFDGEISYPMPDLKTLKWINTEVEGWPALRLTGLKMPFGPVQPSPDGSGLALMFTKTAFNAPGGYLAGLLIIDRLGNPPWLAVESANSDQHSFQWLPDNRLIWVNQGKLYTARIDGSQKVHYPIPEPVYEIWSDGEWAIVSGGDLWRVHLVTRQAAKIEGLHSVTGTGINANITYVPPELLINNAGMLIQIPLDPALPITTYDRIAYPGMGGRIGKPFSIGEKYLFPGVPAISGNDVRPVVFERGHPQPMPLQSLLPLETGQFALGLSKSHDGSWVSIGVYEKNTDRSPNPYKPIGSYLAPANELKNGRLILHGENVGGGWKTNPLAYFFVSDGVMTQVSLPSFEENVIGRINPFIYATESFLVLRQDSLIALFDQDMQLKTLINLPYQFNEFSLNTGKQDQLYMIVSRSQIEGNECVTTSWLDVIQLIEP